MNYMHFFTIVIIIWALAACAPKPFEPTAEPVAQMAIARVEGMPNEPAPYAMKDWYQVARDFDAYVYDFSQTGDYLPLIWLDPNQRNLDQSTFGIFTALGDIRQGVGKNLEAHEGLGVLGSILGATLVGIDKSNQDGRNYVRMARNYFNKDTGWNIIMNFTNPAGHIGGGYGNDWWYDVYNNVLFYAVGNYYPDAGYDAMMQIVAEQFYKSDSILGDNYSYSFFDFKNMQPGTNHIVPQEDAAAGYAFVLYAAYQKFGDKKYLQAAQHALTVLANQPENRFYEILMPFGAYVAARMNAEQGTDFDVQRFINWTLDGDATNRIGWGALSDNWGGYDVHGVIGSTDHNGGYGFLMNTFDVAWPFAALVRYDQRYARAVGKWLLNAANAARMFYPYEMPDSLQAIPGHKAVTKNLIAYEGIIKESTYEQFKGITPFVQGDGPNWAPGMPPETMFSVYGSAHVGIFGGIIRKTNVEKILQVDCRKTDMFRQYDAYPTWLYFNPYPEVKRVRIDLGAEAVDVYDAIGRELLQRGVKGEITFDIPGDAARLLVLVPAGSRYTQQGNMLLANDVPIDFRYNNISN